MKAAEIILVTAAVFFSIATGNASAHVEAEPADSASELTARIIEPDLFTAGTETPIFIEVKSPNTQADALDLDVTVAVEDASGKKTLVGKAEKKNNVYVFSYKFPSGGEYTVHAESLFQNSEVDFDFRLFVSEPLTQEKDATALGTTITAIILIIVAITTGVLKKRLKTALIVSLIIALAALLAYSLYATFKSGAFEGGVVTCTENGCFWTAHVHAFVPIEVCGEEYRLPIEVGLLDGPHTHEEKNTIHWHDRLPYDNDNKKITDTKPLTLGAFFDSIGVAFDGDRIAEKKNGDVCPNEPIRAQCTKSPCDQLTKAKMFVNGESNSTFRDYIWSDKDVIQIFFDSRDASLIKSGIDANPTVFPKLGRG